MFFFLKGYFQTSSSLITSCLVLWRVKTVKRTRHCKASIYKKNTQNQGSRIYVLRNVKRLRFKKVNKLPERECSLLKQRFTCIHEFAKTKSLVFVKEGFNGADSTRKISRKWFYNEENPNLNNRKSFFLPASSTTSIIPIAEYFNFLFFFFLFGELYEKFSRTFTDAVFFFVVHLLHNSLKIFP